MMNQKDLTYTGLLGKLKKTEPVLHDAGELTDSIMQRIEQEKPAHKVARIMRISALLSGIAASLLIGLLVYETMRYPVPVTRAYSEYAVQIPESDNLLLVGKKIDDLKPGEKEKIVNEYIKNREAQRIQKERWRTSFIITHRLIKGNID